MTSTRHRYLPHRRRDRRVLRGAAHHPRRVRGFLIDRGGRILLVERVYDALWPWDLSGGIIESASRRLSACQRELREELGLDPVIEHLAATDWVPPRPSKTPGNMYVFTGRLPSPARIRLDPLN